ncbi:MBL fold metallo-hydrolase [Leucobacter sp. UCMA 4100]|uniref:MBL fold metallo-hydrolase n=1 Tax=Leucobacter sp. UCMA 4100 TaxID=2810534 RepID=UPI0022EB94A4|nr:MBL fold metallo-hydrolase [Leucobacter sp. UCMA 4100]MDA3147633.1 MBL fold metallo-hydrolase [Leucobacter sp. UCMA 4100]
MRVLSDNQCEAASAHGVPRHEEVREGLWAVAVPMPGSFLSYTLSMVMLHADGQVYVIDPGSEGEATVEIFRDFLASQGRSLADIATIVVTHSHPDHLGSAARLRELSGATVVMHAREQEEVEGSQSRLIAQLREQVAAWGMPDAEMRALLDMMDRADYGEHPDIRADVLVQDGDEIAETGWRVVATPGHTAGHMCLVDDMQKLLFSGDHVLPTVNPGIGLSGSRDNENAVVDFLASLERLEPFDDYEVCPGHGYRFHGLKERRLEQAAHVHKRAHEVETILARNPDLSVWGIAEQLTWSAGWQTLLKSTLLASGLAQTSMYRDAVRAGITSRMPAPAPVKSR